jgi:hypothetical protein
LSDLRVFKNCLYGGVQHFFIAFMQFFCNPVERWPIAALQYQPNS